MADPRTSLSEDEILRILQKRAAALAKPPGRERAGAATRVLVMHVGDERYGVNVDRVLEIRPLDTMTPVPGLPPIWSGLVNLRGVLYPVLDGRRYLGLESDGSPEAPYVVVLADDDLVIGFLADRIAGLRTILVEDINAPLGADAHAHRKAVSGVTPDLLLLLDVDALLQDPALVVDDEAS